MISIDATPSRAFVATMAIAAGALMPNVSSAQQVSTCYTKQNGTVYRVMSTSGARMRLRALQLGPDRVRHGIFA